MSSATITKAVIANGLKEIMKSKPFVKVVVSDIIQACDVSRSTFYYHFTDKFDLLNWIFTSEALPIIQEYCTPDNWMDGYIKLCVYFGENRQFYQKAFEYTGQNSLYQNLLSFYTDLFSSSEFITHGSCNYQASGTSNEMYQMIAKLHANAYVGMIREWTNRGLDKSYINRLYDLRKVQKTWNSALVS